MNPTIENARERFDALDTAFRAYAFRERVLMAICASACVFMLIDQLAIQPQSERQQEVSRAYAFAKAENAAIEAELATLARHELSEEQRLRLDEIKQLREQVEQIERRLSREVGALVPPEAIVSLLEEVLAQTPDLALIRVESQPPERLGRESTDRTAQPISAASGGLFRHGLQIEIEGSYLATLDYLERLESSSWNLLFDRLVIEMQSYPTARVQIELHTISGNEEWVGV